MTERQAPTVRQALANLLALWDRYARIEEKTLIAAFEAAREILSHPEPDRAALVERLNVYVAALLYDSGGENDDEVRLIREAAAVLESIATREWIPVGERLPTEGEIVVCRAAGGELALSWLHQGVWALFKPTHWMPLPEPPHE